MSKKVLIAEDYGDVRQMMKLLLEMYGYEALEASDGREAVEKVRKYHPDLVLMDIMMPYMDGIEATKNIRGMGEIGEIPIVAVTAHDDFFRESVKDAGFTAILSKPLFFDELGPILENYLESPGASVAVKAHSGH